MKITVLSLKNTLPVIKEQSDKLTKYLSEKHEIENVEISGIKLNEAGNPQVGLITSGEYSLDATPYLNRYGMDADWLIVLWDGRPYENWRAVSGWTGKQILTSMPLSSKDDFYRVTSHEIEHGLWGYLIFEKRVPSGDTMDYRLKDLSYSKEDQPDAPDGNRARSIAAMLPYKPLIRARFDPQSSLRPVSSLPDSRTIIEKLTWYVGYLTGKMKAPAGYEGILKTFGSPGDSNIVTFDLPYPLYYNGVKVTQSRCHKLMVPIFQSTLKDIKEKGLDKYVQNYGGIYSARLIRDGDTPSTHSWGIAIDIEPLTYPLGSDKRMPQAVIDVFKAHGFTYGGDWTGRKDPQHFQYASGY